MAELVSQPAIKPKQTIRDNGDDTFTVWEVYVKDDIEIYFRKRNADGTWDAEIHIQKGTNPDVFYLNNELHLLFDYNGKIFYRFWPADENPVLVKPPGVLQDCATISGPLGKANSDRTHIPTNFERIRTGIIKWDQPAVAMGLHILGYNLYKISTSGIATLQNSELIPHIEGQTMWHEITPVNGEGYFVTTVTYSGYGQTQYESLRTNVIFINANELWVDEVLNFGDSLAATPWIPTQIDPVTFQTGGDEGFVGGMSPGWVIIPPGANSAQYNFTESTTAPGGSIAYLFMMGKELKSEVIG